MGLTCASLHIFSANGDVLLCCNFYEQAMTRLSADWDPKDHCHYVPGLFRYANNHELLAMVAPKPLLR